MSVRWDPIRGTLPGEYDRYGIASLLGSRAPREALVEELGRIRRHELGLDKNVEHDAAAAAEIGDGVDHATRSR